MAAGAAAKNTDPLRVEIECLRVGAQMADGAFGVLDLRGELELRCEALVDGEKEVAAFCQLRHGGQSKDEMNLSSHGVGIAGWQGASPGAPQIGRATNSARTE